MYMNSNCALSALVCSEITGATCSADASVLSQQSQAMVLCWYLFRKQVRCSTAAPRARNGSALF